jgi:hypothetical protein
MSDEIECALASRGRCLSGKPKQDAEGRIFFFSENTMTWVDIQALAASPTPGRVLCLEC